MKNKNPLEVAESWVLPACLVLSIALVLGGVLFIFRPHVALAAPKPGLWLEQSTQADGVLIRKIRDTFDGNICYVATRDNGVTGDKLPPTISCVPDRKP